MDEIISTNIKDNKTNKIQPKYILARSLCIKMQSYLKEEKIDYKNNKKYYEIYKIKFDKNEEIFTANIKYLPIDNGDTQELYFDKEIALEISKNLNCVNNNVINSCPEIMEEYQKELYIKEQQLKELRLLDELKFKNASMGKGLLNISKCQYKAMQNERKYLLEQIKKYHDSNSRLMKRLQISLDKYEKIKSKRNNIFYKILYRFSK